MKFLALVFVFISTNAFCENVSDLLKKEPIKIESQKDKETVIPDSDYRIVPEKKAKKEKVIKIIPEFESLK